MAPAAREQAFAGALLTEDVEEPTLSVDADYLEHMAAESREGDVTPPPSRKSTPLPLGEEATDFGDRLRFVLCVRRGINEALVNESLAEARALMPRRSR